MAQALALCITDLDVGGAERCLVELATRVDRTRYSPTVYCLQPLPAANELIERLRSAGIEICSLNARRTIDFLPAVWRLAHELKRRKTEVLQSFLFHANIVGRLAAYKAGVRRVCSGIRVAEPERRWRLWLERATGRLITRQVCVSRSVAEFAVRVGGLPRDKLLVIGNGVDVARFDSAAPADLTALGLGPNRRAVIFIGRLEPQKRVDWLLRSAARWLPQFEDVDLVIVGSGREREALTTLALDLGLATRVHFAGWRADVPSLLKASRLLVLSSAYEGMPNVVLEAMAAGLPVVATDVEGVREALGPAAEEQVVAAQDPAAFAEKMTNLLSNSGLAKRLGEENHLRATCDFSLEKMVRAYQAAWDAE
jgi:starch synthase (maltosyl-transferring)